MRLTPINSQVILTHLKAFRHSINNELPSDDPLVFPTETVLASLFLSIGPQLSAIIHDGIIDSAITLPCFNQKEITEIDSLLDCAICSLEKSISENTPPSLNFKEIIAQLLERFGPIILELLIGILLQKDADQTP
jgi:hypothetical protein